MGDVVVAKSPEEMAATMIKNLAEKTGKTLAQWLKITKASKLVKHGEIMKLLKGEHAVTHGYANMIALKTLEGGKAPASGKDLVSGQYAGPKAELRPIYDAVLAAVKKFGKDMEVSPKKAYVSLRRNKQFAIIQPSTKTRVDVGINLKGHGATNRLETSGSFNAMVSHRVRLGDKKEVNKELINWLREAYDNA